jgi:hypothetical protein
MHIEVLSRYMQFHPLAYIVKLKIEMSMADLIARVAQEPNSGVQTSSSTLSGLHHSPSKTDPTNANGGNNRLRNFDQNAPKTINWYSTGKDLQDIRNDENGMELRDRTSNIKVQTENDISIMVEHAVVVAQSESSGSRPSSGRSANKREEDLIPLRDEE